MTRSDCADTTTVPHSFIDPDPAFLPVWARSRVQYAQNLLECSDEPIEYCEDDEDYHDNCFFFPEDCVYHTPSRRTGNHPDAIRPKSNEDGTGTMNIPVLPDIKMLDPSALSELLRDNLSPPEITSIAIFSATGTVFAYASHMPQRQLRTLASTYGAAYASYAVNSSKGNLTGVNPTSHPSSFVTTPSIPLGDVGSIIFELEEQDQVAVVTQIADKVLLAVEGPTHIDPQKHTAKSAGRQVASRSALSDLTRAATTTTSPEPTATTQQGGKAASSAPNPGYLSSNKEKSKSPPSSQDEAADEALRAQWEIDRKSDLERLASLGLTSSPSILLALESKSAALGKFLGDKLTDLENQEDF